MDEHSLIDTFGVLKPLYEGSCYFFYSLDEFEKKHRPELRRLPLSVRIMLESLIRNCDEEIVTKTQVKKVAAWKTSALSDIEIPFVVSRVILQDFTGVPLLVDLAAMKDAMVKAGASSDWIEPAVPVDLVVDHSVQVDRFGSSDAFDLNLTQEFNRNLERYAFLKWGQDAFKALKIFPPGIGIVHQINLEYLAELVMAKKVKDRVLLYPDTLVGTDSHTTMVNAVGVVGWGVGGIEAEASMLGQPAYLEAPEVIGFHFKGALKEGVTATDLTLRVTEILRKENVVGKFIEFFGEGASNLSVADRAPISNMAPEYGATLAYFPVDENTMEYLKTTGRSEKQIALIRDYLKAQHLFGMPKPGEIDYSKTLELDLSTIKPSIAGPKRPQDRIDLIEAQNSFHHALLAPTNSGGYGKTLGDLTDFVNISLDRPLSLPNQHETGGKPYLGSNSIKIAWSEEEMVTNRPLTPEDERISFDKKQIDKLHNQRLAHGSIVIAAITSCTNTSNPSLMLSAGILAKKAFQKGLKVNPLIKTSLAPGSRVVTDYLKKTGLQEYLDELGFQLVAYGCTTCIGNSGPLEEHIEQAIKSKDLVVASVLSGNRNFEARIHSAVKANYLMSPPLVVAFALAGRIDIDVEKEPLGYSDEGNAIYLRDIWPTSIEIKDALLNGLDPQMFKTRYENILKEVPAWQQVKKTDQPWLEDSSYIQCPPYFENFKATLPKLPILKNLKALAIFSDSVTTDHISPAGSIRKDSPAGKYLLSLGISEKDFNSYGSRRGNHNIMVRGTFANVRTRNKMVEGIEGGYTKLMPEGQVMSIFEASQIYQNQSTPLIIFAGKDYGMGSSRDWAAKGTALLGVKVVVAMSFERIHRSNLIGMGVLPLQFEEGMNPESLRLVEAVSFSIEGFEKEIHPRQSLLLHIHFSDSSKTIPLISRLDTRVEVEYYRHGGILPYVLRQKLQKAHMPCS